MFKRVGIVQIARSLFLCVLFAGDLGGRATAVHVQQACHST